MDASCTFFLEALHGTLKPATGCTEPAAIALNAATARKHAQGTFARLLLRLDSFLYKNAMGVGIPGADQRGVALCAALGVTAGDADAGINVLHHVTPQALCEAKQLLCEGRITVEVLDLDDLCVQSVLETDVDSVRVTTCCRHDNIISVEHAPFPPMEMQAAGSVQSPIAQYSLHDMVTFAREVPLDELLFLQEGVDMNLAIAQAGCEMDLGRAMKKVMERAHETGSPIMQAKFLSASAAYARMIGTSLPVMTATGSGNQGITVTLTVEGAAQALGVTHEAKLRALALAHLVNMYGKAHVGSLSALCSCGISSGLGASVATVFMLGGSEMQMMAAAQNIIGSICGMICDGAKEGCANKVELASGLAVQAALLAVEGACIPCNNGILSGEWAELFENLGTVARDGMRETNRIIVKIMQKEHNT